MALGAIKDAALQELSGSGNNSTHSKPQHQYEAIRIFRWKMKALIVLVINS